MAGKEIYLGVMFDNLITALNATVAKQQEIVENTAYISNLYDAIDLRQSLTYSSGAATLAGALDVFYKGTLSYNNAVIVPTKTKVPETCIGYTGATSTTKKIVYSYTTDFTDIATLKLDLTMVNGHSSGVRAGGIVVGGTTLVNWSGLASIARGLQVLDVSAITGVQELKITTFAAEASESSCTLTIYNMHLYNAAGDIVDVLVPFSNHAITANSITMAAGALESVFYIKALSTAPASISKYDLLAIMCDLPTGTAIEIDVIKSDFTVLKAAVGNGDYIGDLTFLNVYLKITFTRETAGTTSPTLSSVAFRYIV